LHNDIDVTDNTKWFNNALAITFSFADKLITLLILQKAIEICIANVYDVIV
jgi:hypothetical protein